MRKKHQKTLAVFDGWQYHLLHQGTDDRKQMQQKTPEDPKELLRELAAHLAHSAGLNEKPASPSIGSLVLSMSDGALWRRVCDCIGTSNPGDMVHELVVKAIADRRITAASGNDKELLEAWNAYRGGDAEDDAVHPMFHDAFKAGFDAANSGMVDKSLVAKWLGAVLPDLRDMFVVEFDVKE